MHRGIKKVSSHTTEAKEEENRCLNCNAKFGKNQRVYHDTLGNHMICNKCQSSSNVFVK